ncbi:unnamed protein product, partial [Amoebophrya sp. A25]|eukprot:GSA25T00015499001.1
MDRYSALGPDALLKQVAQPAYAWKIVFPETTDARTGRQLSEEQIAENFLREVTSLEGAVAIQQYLEDKTETLNQHIQYNARVLEQTLGLFRITGKINTKWIEQGGISFSSNNGGGVSTSTAKQGEFAYNCSGDVDMLGMGCMKEQAASSAAKGSWSEGDQEDSLYQGPQVREVALSPISCSADAIQQQITRVPGVHCYSTDAYGNATVQSAPPPPYQPGVDHWPGAFYNQHSPSTFASPLGSQSFED